MAYSAHLIDRAVDEAQREKLQSFSASSTAARILAPLLRHSIKRLISPRFSVAAQRRSIELCSYLLAPVFAVSRETTQLNSVRAEIYRSKSASTTSDKVILYIHGGGLMVGSSQSYRGLTGRLCKLARIPVYSVNYRLAPEHKRDVALEDVYLAWQGLLDLGYAPDQIAVAGDSAGGNLALALALRLREQDQVQPASVSLISPWLDVSGTQLAQVDDAVLGEAWIRQAAESGLRHPQTPDIESPINEEFEGLAPISIQCAGGEPLLNDALRAQEKLQAAGVEHQLLVVPGLWHDFQLFAGLVPEANQSLTAIAEFIRAH